MEKKAGIRERYAQMMETSDKPVPENRVNCYVCSQTKCGHITKVIDVDYGVTPMFLNCEKCGKQASSTFYTDVAPDQKPTIEWFRPTLEQTLQFVKKQQMGMVEHILMGGLEMRKIANK